MADALLRCFEPAGGLVLDASYLPRLEKVVLTEDGHPNRRYIGKNAATILHELGISAGDDLRMIVVEVGHDHPLVRNETMMPVLPLVRANNFEEAVNLAVAIEGGLRHTAIIHSANINHMSEFAKAVNTTIFVKNAPSYAGIGFGGEGPTSFTIARSQRGGTDHRARIRPQAALHPRRRVFRWCNEGGELRGYGEPCR